jgi:hypothetical protein
MAATAAVKAAAPAVADRFQGRQPSRTRALFAALVVGVAAAAGTYKLLRSASESDGGNDSD